MKSTARVLLLALFAITFVLAHHNRTHTAPSSVCRYHNTKGEDYDLRVLQHHFMKDIQYDINANMYYLHPCGPVAFNKPEECGKDSSVCLRNSDQKMISFGSYNSMQFADLPNGLEVTYGNGEICSNGVPRKAIVSYIFDNVTTGYRIKSFVADECSVTITIISPFVRPLADYCGALNNYEHCHRENEGICTWSGSKCVVAEASGCHWTRHWHSSSHTFLIALLASLGFLLLCTLGICVCACKSRRLRAKRCAMKRCATKRRCARRAQRKAEKTAETGKEYEQQQIPVDYAPFQGSIQLIPGGFAPVNPYNMQGYPMVQFVAPMPQQVEGEQV